MQRKKKKKGGRRNNNRQGSGPNGAFRGTIKVSKEVVPWKKSGRLNPRPGAEITVRQLVWGGSFATHSGMTGGSNNIFMVNSGGFAAVFSHALSDLPQASTWTAAFDQYRMEQIEIHMYPIISQATTTNTATNFAGATQCVLDFDDGTALGSENAALEYDNCQTLMHYDHVCVRFKPAVSPAYYSSGAFTGYGVAPSEAEWLDAASPAIVHYGTKYWIGSLAPASTMLAGWVVYGQYTVSFRNTR